MKKITRAFLTLLAALSVLMFVSCGDSVLSARQISKKNWKEFKGTWEVSYSINYGADDDIESDTEEIVIEDKDDFEDFVEILTQFEAELGVEDFDDSEIKDMGGSVKITGDKKGFKYSNGSLSREIGISMNLLGQNIDMKAKFSAKKK